MKCRVLWTHEIEATSLEDAAFKAFQTQRSMPASQASYNVVADDGRTTTVKITDTVPLERLTPREQEIARLIMAGATNKDIASTLNVTVRTVKAHVGHTFEKLGVKNRMSLATMLLRVERRQP